MQNTTKHQKISDETLTAVAINFMAALPVALFLSIFAVYFGWLIFLSIFTGFTLVLTALFACIRLPKILRVLTTWFKQLPKNEHINNPYSSKNYGATVLAELRDPINSPAMSSLRGNIYYHVRHMDNRRH